MSSIPDLQREFLEEVLGTTTGALTLDDLQKRWYSNLIAWVAAGKPVVADVTVNAADPTVTDDTSEGFVLYDRWFNSTSGELFIVLDVTEGAAVWQTLTLTTDDLGTMAVEAASDYGRVETGTWTPSVGGTATYNAQLGYYTRIGPLVFVRFDLNINTIGTGSTSIVSGLPYQSIHNIEGIPIAFSSGLAVSPVELIATVNTSAMTMRGRTAAAAGHSTLAIFGDGARIIGSGVYSTDNAFIT